MCGAISQGGQRPSQPRVACDRPAGGMGWQLGRNLLGDGTWHTQVPGPGHRGVSGKQLRPSQGRAGAVLFLHTQTARLGSPWRMRD